MFVPNPEKVQPTMQPIQHRSSISKSHLTRQKPCQQPKYILDDGHEPDLCIQPIFYSTLPLVCVHSHSLLHSLPSLDFNLINFNDLSHDLTNSHVNFVDNNHIYDDDSHINFDDDDDSHVYDNKHDVDDNNNNNFININNFIW